VDAAGDRPGRLPEVRVSLVSDNYFRTLGADVVLGRPLMAADGSGDADGTVAVISDAFWRRWFAASPDVLRRTIELRGTKYSIVGVARAGFTGFSVGAPSDVWLPLQMYGQFMRSERNLLDPAVAGGDRWLKVIGRLDDSTGPGQASASVDRLWQALIVESAADGDTKRRHAGNRERAYLVPAATGDAPARAQLRRPLWIVAAITGLVLLIACINFANLMFARAQRRRSEFAIRLALGGGTFRLARQIAIECLVLTLAAGAGALLIASWAMSIAMPVAASILSIETGFELNFRVVAFAAACAALAACVGFVPASRPVRRPSTASARHAANRFGTGPKSRAFRVALVAQFAMCAVLLVGAGLLLRTVINLRTQDLGFDRNVLLVPVSAGRGAGSEEGAAAILREIRRQLTGLGGVTAVGVSGPTLLDSTNYWLDTSTRLSTDRGPVSAGIQWTSASVGEGFFAAAGMKILKGHTFDDAEVAGQQDVAILSQSLARFLFGEEDPVGRRVATSARGPMHRVVGIVSDARQVSPRDRGVGVMYLPIRSIGQAILAVRVADSVSPGVLRQPVDGIVGRYLAGRVRTIAEALDLAIARERLLSGVAIFLAVLVVLIGCVGLFALMTYDVERRRRELGIRLALGATARQVKAMVMLDGAALIVPALAIGVPAGIVMSRTLSSQLYGVEIADPWTLLCVGLLLSLVGLAATFRPAARASRIDPLTLLRDE